MRGFVVLVVVLMLVEMLISVPSHASFTERVSISSSGEQANAGSAYVSISADGRYVAFASGASNLISGDTNINEDVFVLDRSTRVVECVSVSSRNEQGNSGSRYPAISEDGRYVAFQSRASNLVLGDTNGREDIFVRDRLSGITEQVSVSSSGVQGNSWSGYSSPPAISADGRYVTFESWSTNLVSGDTNGKCDMFVRDRVAGTTERVSVSSSGDQGNGDSGYYGNLDISADGRYVAFESTASNLVTGDTNGCYDVFVRDRQTGMTERVSISSSGGQGSSSSGLCVSINTDGRYVAFVSSASNLVSGDTNACYDIFVRDRFAGTTERVSVSSSGAQGSQSSRYTDISGDGRYVAFESLASNLAPGDTNAKYDIYLRDRQEGTTERISVSSAGGQADQDCMEPSISADGGYVAFDSAASNLIAGDTNKTFDIFLRDRWGTGVPVISVAPVSVDFGTTSVGNLVTRQVAVSNTGSAHLTVQSITSNHLAITASPSGFTIPPMGSQTVRLMYLPTQPESLSAAITINSDDPNNPAVQIAATGVSTPPPVIAVTPVSITASVEAGTSVSKTLSVGNNGGSPLAFAVHPTDASWCALSPMSGTVPAGESQQLVVTLDAGSLTGGDHLTTIRITSNDLVTPQVEVPVNFHVWGTPNIAVNPASINYGTVYIGQPWLADITITNTGTDILSITGITSTSPAVTASPASFTVSAKGSATVTLTYLPTRTESLSATVSIAGNDADTPLVNIQVSGSSEQGMLSRVSISSDGVIGNNSSDYCSISADGRYVVFESYASNLVPGDTNGKWDVFVRDTLAGTTERVSISTSGEQGNASCTESSISADGRYVVFLSGSSTLVSGDNNSRDDVFVRDRLNGTTELVSVSSNGEHGNSDSWNPSISADGRYVAFVSASSNLVAGYNYGVFVRDRQTGTTELVSVPINGGRVDGSCHEARISADGRFVAFTSWAPNLVSGDTNGDFDVFVRDRLAGTTERISVSSSEEQGSGWAPSISADGRYVAFYSDAASMFPGAIGFSGDIFVRDRLTGTTELISVTKNGQRKSDSRSPVISADGRYVCFYSYTSDLVPGDTNNGSDVFVRDRYLGTTERVSLSVSGEQADGGNGYASISADGRFVAFVSSCPNLVGGDTNGASDIFLKDTGLRPGPKTIADGTPIAITTYAITGAFSGFFYIEEANRASGIMVLSPENVVQGKRVMVTGKMTTVSGERAIQAESVTMLDDLLIKPLGMAADRLGGSALGLQAGVVNSTGLNNIGLLVCTWGKFTYIDPTAFMINDGSRAIKCEVPAGITLNPDWRYVSVTGICSCYQDVDILLPIVRVRSQGDITVLE